MKIKTKLNRDNSITAYAKVKNKSGNTFVHYTDVYSNWSNLYRAREKAREYFLDDIGERNLTIEKEAK